MEADSTRDTTVERRQQQDAVKIHTQNHPPGGAGHNLQFRLGKRLRMRRFKWLGHILRAGPGHITFKAIEEQKRLGLPVNILMDAPQHNTLWDLVTQAKDDRTHARALTASI